MLHLPLSPFDKILINQTHHLTNFLTNSNLYHALFTNFGIDNFNFFIPIIILTGAYEFTKWYDAKMQSDGMFANKVNIIINDKKILITISSILVIIIIML